MTAIYGLFPGMSTSPGNEPGLTAEQSLDSDQCLSPGEQHAHPLSTHPVAQVIVNSVFASFTCCYDVNRDFPVIYLIDQAVSDRA